MKLSQRILVPTPLFFRKRSIGLVLIASGTAVIAVPQRLPADLVHVAGYMLVVGGVLSAVSQTTVRHDQ